MAISSTCATRSWQKCVKSVPHLPKTRGRCFPFILRFIRCRDTDLLTFGEPRNVDQSHRTTFRFSETTFRGGFHNSRLFVHAIADAVVRKWLYPMNQQNLKCLSKLSSRTDHSASCPGLRRPFFHRTRAESYFFSLL